MKTRLGWAIVIGALLLATLSPAWGQISVKATAIGPAMGPKAEMTRPPKLVTLNLENVPLREALQQFLAASDFSVIIIGDVPEEPKVTMRLKDVDPISALQTLTRLGYLDFQIDTSSHAGAPVAAISAGYAWQQAQQSRRSSVNIGGDFSGATGSFPGPLMAVAPLPSLPAEVSGLIVDLEAKNLPFREAIAKLDAQIPASALRPPGRGSLRAPGGKRERAGCTRCRSVGCFRISRSKPTSPMPCRRPRPPRRARRPTPSTWSPDRN